MGAALALRNLWIRFENHTQRSLSALPLPPFGLGPFFAPTLELVLLCPVWATCSPFLFTWELTPLERSALRGLSREMSPTFRYLDPHTLSEQASSNLESDRVLSRTAHAAQLSKQCGSRENEAGWRENRKERGRISFVLDAFRVAQPTMPMPQGMILN